MHLKNVNYLPEKCSWLGEKEEEEEEEEEEVDDDDVELVHSLASRSSFGHQMWISEKTLARSVGRSELLVGFFVRKWKVNEERKGIGVLLLLQLEYCTIRHY